MSNRVKIIIAIVTLFLIGVLIATAIGYFSTKDVEVVENVNISTNLFTPAIVSNTFVAATQKTSVSKDDLLEEAKDVLPLGEYIELFSTKSSVIFVSQSGVISEYTSSEVKELYSFSGSIVFSAVSPDGKKVLVKNDNLDNFLIDLISGVEIELPKEIQNFAWSPSGERIVYQYVDVFDKVNSFFTALPDARDFKKLEEFGADDPTFIGVEISWPKEDTVLWKRQPSGIDGSGLFKLSSEGGASEEITPGIETANSVLSSFDGESVYYDVHSGGLNQDPEFFSVKEYDFDSGVLAEIGLDALLGKCISIPADKLVCAIAEENTGTSSPEILVTFDLNSKELLPITEIVTDEEISYDQLTYITSSHELMYINEITSEISVVSLK